MAHTGIGVIESNWQRKSNLSVRGLFDLIANISCDNPNAYHYEIANSEVAIKEAIPRIGSYRECRYLYIAAHGDEKGLGFLNDDRLTRTELRNLLRDIRNTDGSKLRGLCLGSCLFGTDKLADFLFSEDVGVRWIAGYSTEVAWIESSALDLLFFNELISVEGETDIQAINRTAKRLLEVAPGLVKELGFGIFVRKKKTGGAKNLLGDAYSDDD